MNQNGTSRAILNLPVPVCACVYFFACASFLPCMSLYLRLLLCLCTCLCPCARVRVSVLRRHLRSSLFLSAHFPSASMTPNTLSLDRAARMDPKHQARLKTLTVSNLLRCDLLQLAATCSDSARAHVSRLSARTHTCECKRVRAYVRGCA